ncbi:hypothetical protein [Streptomyces sp. NPDC093094]|uniref:hypothetical protein n=1 Tax=Streptomyces sp. NPDC093094 TaxID=3366026 RepID=UPI003804115F
MRAHGGGDLDAHVEENELEYTVLDEARAYVEALCTASTTWTCCEERERQRSGRTRADGAPEGRGQRRCRRGARRTA